MTNDGIYVGGPDKGKVVKNAFSDLPTWAKWKAQDGRGGASFYKQRPELDPYCPNYWYCFPVHAQSCAEYYTGDWRDSLMKRVTRKEER